MKSFRRAMALCLLIAAPVGGTPSAGVPERADPASIRKGLEALYNLDHASAFSAFEEVIRARPGDPTGYFGRTLAAWWRLETRLGEFSADEEKDFLGSVDRAIQVSEAALERNSRDGYALLCLGGIHGLRGRWSAARHHWLRALWDGRKARRLQERALQLDPTLEDAHMGIGAFDYYVAALPRIVQALRFLGPGHRARGLAGLQRAAARGLFSRTAAKLLLIGIYCNTERRPGEALRLVRELRAEYPESPFMHQLEALVLFESRDGRAMQSVAEAFVRRCESESGRYTRGDLTRGRFLLGAAFGLQGKWAEAAGVLSRAIDEARPTDPYLTAARVERGKAYDSVGRRSDAREDYSRALESPRLWNYRKEASRHLKRPFVPTAEAAPVVPAVGE